MPALFGRKTQESNNKRRQKDTERHHKNHKKQTKSHIIFQKQTNFVLFSLFNLIHGMSIGTNHLVREPLHIERSKLETPRAPLALRTCQTCIFPEQLQMLKLLSLFPSLQRRQNFLPPSPLISAAKTLALQVRHLM